MILVLKLLSVLLCFQACFGKIRIPLHSHGKAVYGKYKLGFSGDNGDDDYAMNLANFMNTQYFGIISLGSPPQPFKFMMDTGSSDVWILSNICKSSITCLIHWKKYDHEQSSSYVNQDSIFTLAYGQGNVTVALSRDDFLLGSNIIKDQHFGEVSSISYKFAGIAFDGIVGMGLPDLSVYNKTPLLYNLFKQNQNMEPVFSVYLSKSENFYDTNGGELLIGGMDPKYYKPPLNTYSVLGDKYWMLRLKGIYADTEKNQCDGLCVAVIDTGTSMIVGPNEDITRLNNMLGATSTILNSVAIFDCNKTNNLPNVTFVFGNESYVLTQDDYILKLGDNCISAFTGIDLNVPKKMKLWILGDVFIRRYYTVFNTRDRTISFAESV